MNLNLKNKKNQQHFTELEHILNIHNKTREPKTINKTEKKTDNQKHK